ncbi:MAG TPA: hypothetical protein VFX20_18105 [Steroidobacteraceae bacterium]|nr:hypothetical protein [Steroidobacteraceae bacterium]
MVVRNSAVLAFNRGLLSELALARVDLSRYKMAAAVMVNWMPRVLGSMIFRPGTGYIGTTDGNAYARTIPFVFSATDTARIEVTAGALRFWVNDALVTRVAVGTTVTNGTFAADTSDWTDSSDAGASVTWSSASNVSFVGTGASNAILDQQVLVASADQGKRHALRIVILQGHFTFRVGTSLGDDSIINETTLDAGTHSIALTAGASFWIRFQASTTYSSTLASCVVEGASTLALPAPWLQADLPNLRKSQSGDVIFVGCVGYQQRRIERRATDSWSIVTYAPEDGPFRPINVTNTTLTPSALFGDITLTANKPLFKAGHVGALFRIESVGQATQNALSTADSFSDMVLVTGVGGQRQLTITISGTWVGTLSLQYSFNPDGPWADQGDTYTANQSLLTFSDGNDNQDIYYRIGFKSGAYTSGTAVVQLFFPSGTIVGICRVTGYTSNTEVSASVIKSMGGTSPTSDWFEGAWSTFRGFPAICSLWQGRLWWFATSIFGSVSDDYSSFDDTILGDSAPIIGQLDSGPVDNIYWAIGLQQLVLGTATAETSARSTYLGDPLTPTNFNVMVGSTQGSANVDALQMDRSGIFVQVTGSRVFSLDLDIYTYSYRSTELSLLVPDLNNAGIVQLALQNKPDRRLHCLRADGTVGILVWDEAENVTCWCEVEIAGGGIVEDISVLPAPGRAEDAVYYLVRRTVNGQTVRYHEKWALESECTGLPLAKNVDAHAVYSGAPAATLAAIAPHLVGQTVAVWGWNTVKPYIDGNGNKPGLDLGAYLVGADGSVGPLQFNGAEYSVTNAVVGLAYTASWQSMKQAFAAALGTPLNQTSRIPRAGVLLQNAHALGLRIGNDFDHLDDLPLDELPRISSADGAAPDTNAVLPVRDNQMSGFNDLWSTDSRVCLQAASPRPCTVLAFTVELETSG